MALAEVGSGSQRATSAAVDNGSSTTLAFPANVTSGNLLVVMGGQTAGGATVVTDTRSTSYTVYQSGAGVFIAVGVALSSGACTVTVDPSATADYSFSIDEFSGQAATPLDVDDGKTTGTDTAPTAGITTVAADTLILGCVSHSGATTTIANNDGTQLGEVETGGSVSEPHNAIFSIVSTQGTYTIDWSLGASRTWSVYLISIAAPGAVGTILGSPIFGDGVRVVTGMF